MVSPTSIKAEEPWYLNYSFSVRFPEHPAFTMDEDEFAMFLKNDVGSLREGSAKEEIEVGAKPGSDNAISTEDVGDAYKSTTNPLVDLFTELEGPVSGPRLGDLIRAAWAHDSLATTKIIWKIRSIHLGDASRDAFYRSAGWLAKHHPLTLIANLQWLSLPVIEKKFPEKGGNKRKFDAMDPIGIKDALGQANDPAAAHSVPNGAAHGYWKDILNILVLAANNKLDVLANPKDVLNVGRGGPEGSSTQRHNFRAQRQANAIRKFDGDPVYRGLHLAITRMFATQLRKDLAAIHGSDAAAKRGISLCAKWAPSHERFHDKHTYIVSSIAELLHPLPNLQALLDDDASLAGDENKTREVYLRHVREEYRKSISALRKHLDVVERHLSAKTYSEIKYDRVPSIAMDNYFPKFVKKDPERFSKYLENVAEGKARISDSILLPSTLILRTRTLNRPKRLNVRSQVEDKVLDSQWKALVQRIKDLGILGSSISVCDVSGRMQTSALSDGTTPLDSSIGLSLLIAEVAKPPFRGSFITFGTQPRVRQVDLSQTLHRKYTSMDNSESGRTTSLASVFEDAILPLAKDHSVEQYDMVKRVFIFTDRHFDEGTVDGGSWASSHERITGSFKEAGYDIPELVYWNLAGGASNGSLDRSAGDNGNNIPKQVTSDMPGMTIVSGYTRGMLKAFLGDGFFGDSDEEGDTMAEGDGSNGDTVEVSNREEQLDPVSLVQKAIGHRAYSMLQVMD
ncbi:uncharacterized protein DNG_05625 [Cephalotrichum gorgonifer]|uniref:DUF2828 domain-containing protein n=1 Tax=Cephalotrichum gorgonifer TaxID=2041049 RepID=A0AAE8MY82_9PEZI|nr:uncharacterized protein DNG_05625 [Cephalotrichum gorgonifer]